MADAPLINRSIIRWEPLKTTNAVLWFAIFSINGKEYLNNIGKLVPNTKENMIAMAVADKMGV